VNHTIDAEPVHWQNLHMRDAGIEHARHPDPQRQSRCCARQSRQQTLREQLPHDSCPAAADCEAAGDLLPARVGPRQN
jgi:hypothetical protein